MGHSRDSKAGNHERIVDIAAARIRESGAATPGVAEIMEAAGLTHGGFYKHFSSRDELVAEAAVRAFADGERATRAITAEAKDPLAAFVDWYTSGEHRDDPGSGCAVVALGADAPRGEQRLRNAYTEQVRRYLANLEQLLGGDEDARARATVALSALVGSLMLARAVDDPALSDEILRDVRDAVKSSAPAP